MKTKEGEGKIRKWEKKWKSSLTQGLRWTKNKTFGRKPLTISSSFSHPKNTRRKARVLRVRSKRACVNGGDACHRDFRSFPWPKDYFTPYTCNLLPKIILCHLSLTLTIDWLGPAGYWNWDFCLPETNQSTSLGLPINLFLLIWKEP